MTYPIIRGRDLCAGQLTGDIGDQLHLRCVIGNALGHHAEGSEHWFHQWRMEGVRNGQLAALHPRRRELFGNRQHRVTFTGDDNTLWAIHSGNRDVIGVRGKRRLGLSFECCAGRNSHERDHRAVLRQRPHQSPPRRHQF